MKIERREGRSICRARADEIEGEAVDGGLRIVAVDDDCDRVELVLDLLQLADLLNDAGLPVEVDDGQPADVTWDSEKNVLAVRTEAWILAQLRRGGP